MPEALARELDPATLDRIIETLEPFVSLPRLSRLEQSLATRTRDVVLVLEDITNEHNGAAVLRTAEAFGFFELHVVEPRSFKISKKVSKGSEKWLDLARWAKAEDAYAALRSRGYQLWASTLHGDAIDVDQIPIEQKLALVFGNELLGLSPGAIASADGYFRIPMSGFVESFNISVAAAITAYDLWLRRRRGGRGPGLDPADHRQVRAAWLARAVKSAESILARENLPLPVLHRNRFVEVANETP